MPITTKVGLPTDVDPANASVFDPLWKTVARKAVGLMGWDDPNNQVLGVGNPLVSIYPTKAEREVGTQVFKNSAQRFANPALTEATEWFANKYPRIAAHMRLQRAPLSSIINRPSAMAYVMNRAGRVASPETINMGVRIGQDIGENPNIARNIIAHEGTHVAQHLMNSDYKDLYEAAGNLGGTMGNPYEMSAYSIGKAAEEGIPSTITRAVGTGDPNFTSLKEFMRLAQSAPPGTNPDVDTIRNILTRRGLIK